MSTFSSISATFNQLPCFDVYIKSNLYPIVPLPSLMEMLHRGSGICVFRLVPLQRNFICIFLLKCNFFQKKSQVFRGFSFSNFQHSFSCQWFTGKEHIAHPVMLVFNYSQSYLAGFPGEQGTGILVYSNQLFWEFVHTYPLPGVTV